MTVLMQPVGAGSWHTSLLEQGVARFKILQNRKALRPGALSVSEATLGWGPPASRCAVLYTTSEIFR